MTAVAQECRFDVGLMEPNSDFDGNTVLPSASSWWLKEGSWCVHAHACCTTVATSPTTRAAPKLK